MSTRSNSPTAGDAPSSGAEPKRYTAFAGGRRIAAGELMQLALDVKAHFQDAPVDGVLIFEDGTSQPVEIDFRGSADDVARRIAQTSGDANAATEPAATRPDAPRGPGRPRLGVVAREVTLLPRHWDWLSTQPGGASVALRKLVEEARRAGGERDRKRAAQEASYRFMSSTLGNEPNCEDAMRALFAGNRARFDELVEPWPADLRDYLKTLAAPAFRASADERST
jgi:hypothetical protein